jgi:hypothetical protein
LARRFRPSEVKAVCQEVVDGFLKDKEWKGEEEAVWTRTLADEIRSRVNGELLVLKPHSPTAH